MKRLKGCKLEKETGGAKSRKAASLEKAELHSDPWKRNIKIWPHLALLASCFFSGAVVCCRQSLEQYVQGVSPHHGAGNTVRMKERMIRARIG